jgi:hypothetical protein
MDDIPTAAREGLRFEFLKTVDEALAVALEPEASGEFPSSQELAAGSIS